MKNPSSSSSSSSSSSEMKQKSWPMSPQNSDRTDLNAIYQRMALDRKSSPKHSIAEFAALTVVGVPLYFSFILPLTVVSQLAGTVLQRNSSSKNTDSLDNNNNADDESKKKEMALIESNRKERNRRTYDVVLLGATGFTGQLAVEYLCEVYGVGKKDGIKWAIAGRNLRKLEEIKQKLAEKLDDNSIHNLDTIIVDTKERSTLHDLVKDTRVVASTAGPFNLYGSPVVEFCAKYGTHYVDITGETDWNREMMDKWDNTARETNCKIISLCGHDCVPWDLTAHELSSLIRGQESEEEELKDVVIYNEIKAGISGGTIATMLTFVEGTYVPKKFAVDPYMWTASDKHKSSIKTKNQSPLIMGKCQTAGSNRRFQSKWEVPFLMSNVNGDVVRRTNALRDQTSKDESTKKKQHLITYRESLVVPNFMTAFCEWFGLVFFGTALANPITRPLLKTLLPKPGEGPTRELMDRGFLTISGFGYGTKGSEVESVMYFPSDGGYKDTARMIVESALCLALTSDDKLPIQGGGFYSPAASMGKALLDRLCKTGTMFASRIVVRGDGTIKSKL